MADVTILKGFTAYPRGRKEHFAKGSSQTVAEDVAKQWSKKGLARRKPEPKPETAPAPKSAETSSD